MKVSASTAATIAIIAVSLILAPFTIGVAVEKPNLEGNKHFLSE